MILILSSDAGAMTKTSRFIRPLLELLFPSASEETLMFYHGLIRKAAHLTEYGILAILAARVFAGSARTALSKYWYIAAMWLVALVAIVDELNQSLLSTRTGSIYDVYLDIAGGALAVIVLATLGRWRLVRGFLYGR